MQNQANREPVPITGVHLRRVGDAAYVDIEMDGKWVTVIQEDINSQFGHIVEPSGMRAAREAKRHE